MSLESSPAATSKGTATTPADRLLWGILFTNRALRIAFEQYVGVTHARLQLLAHLCATRELTQAELQRRLDVDGAAVTRQVKGLEAEGLLRRWPDPADNRFTLVALTATGLAFMEGLAQKKEAFIRGAMNGVGADELACTQRTLERIRCNLGHQDPLLPCDGG